MSKPNREPQKELPAIEFKSTSLSAIAVVLRSLNMAELEVTMAAMPGNRKRFFDGDGAVLDLGAVAGQTADWPALMALLQGHGVQPLAVCDADEALIATAAMEAGLPCVAAGDLARPRKAAEKAAPAPTAPPAAPTLIVDKPLRSGQRVYAQGGDLVLTAMVSAGAEVIADGSIHVYAPLRGKALAGATGNVNARVFCTCFEAELVSVAGVYRTFENGVPEKYCSLPVSLWLEGNGGKPTLRLESLALR